MAEEADASFMTTVLESISVERIIEYAEENGIDFIVIGTPGRSALDRALASSTTETVIRSVCSDRGVSDYCWRDLDQQVQSD